MHVEGCRLGDAGVEKFPELEGIGHMGFLSAYGDLGWRVLEFGISAFRKTGTPKDLQL